MTGVIYQYTSPKGKKYIGQTLYLQRKRIDKHKYEAFTKNADTPFARAIRKYGWGAIRPTYKVIEVVEAETAESLKNALTDKENYYIQTFDTMLPNGYNVQLTNQRRLGEYRDKEGMYKKISESLKGKYLNGVKSRQIINYDTKEQYPSISEAARQAGLMVQQIIPVLNGKNLTAGGFRWCYVNDDGTIDESNLRGSKRKNLPVYCKELDKTFVSAYEAEKFIGKKGGKSNIRLACMRGGKCYGYTWEYVEE